MAIPIPVCTGSEMMESDRMTAVTKMYTMGKNWREQGRAGGKVVFSSLDF